MAKQQKETKSKKLIHLKVSTVNIIDTKEIKYVITEMSNWHPIIKAFLIYRNVGGIDSNPVLSGIENKFPPHIKETYNGCMFDQLEDATQALEIYRLHLIEMEGDEYDIQII